MGTISQASIAFMIFSALVSTFLPVAFIVYLGKKSLLKSKALLLGMTFFIVFVFIIERIVHTLVLGGVTGYTPIYNNPFTFMLYAGFAAGIFEETARFIGFKFIFKVDRAKNKGIALSYAAGHGGIEALLLGGLGALNNIIYAFMINGGTMTTVLNSLPAAQKEDAMKGINTLIHTNSIMFSMGGIERILALVIQVSLTIIVYKAVSERKFILFPLAILLHAVVDFPAALMQKGILSNIVLVELFITIMAVGIAYFAKRLYKWENNLLEKVTSRVDNPN